MERAVWIILNNNFSLTLDSEIKNGKIERKPVKSLEFGVDGSYNVDYASINANGVKSPNNDSFQKDYDIFISDIMTLFTEPSVDTVFIDAKLGEESEYVNSKEPLVIRKIEEYTVDEIIE